MMFSHKKDKKTTRLSADKIKNSLVGDADVRVFEEIDSTNNEAKRLLESGVFRKTIIAAEKQTSGRGRLGRSFYSPESTGLYFTVILPQNFAFEEVTLLTPAAAVAAARAIERAAHVDVAIKWVNDIYFGDKKICGILAEAVTNSENGALVGVAVGIGINVSTRDFPKEIADIASSLRLENADRNKIAADIANELFTFADDISAREFLPYYRSHSYVTGKDVFVIKGEERYKAKVLGIDDDGGLIIEREDGEQSVLRGGEISIRPFIS